MKIRTLIIVGLVEAVNCVQGAVNSPDSFQTGFYAGGSVGVGQIGANCLCHPVPYNEYNHEYLPASNHSNGLKKSFFQGGISIGFLYRIEETNWVIGMEPYFQGRKLKTSAEWSQTQSHLDYSFQAGEEFYDTAYLEPGDKFLITNEKHFEKVKFPWGWGVNFRIGYVLPQDYLLYGIIGFSRNQAQLEKTVDFGQISTRIIAGQGTPTQIVHDSIRLPLCSANKRKQFWGINYGLGLEKQLKSLRVGVEFIYSRWKKFSINYADHYGHNESCIFRPKNVWGIMLRFTIPF